MTTPKSRSLRRARGPGLQTVPSGGNRQPLWMVHKTPAEFLSLAQAALRQRTSPTQGPAHQHKPCRKGVEQCPAHLGQGVPLNRMFPKYLDQERGEKSGHGITKRYHQNQPQPVLGLNLAEDRLKEGERRESRE